MTDGRALEAKTRASARQDLVVERRARKLLLIGVAATRLVARRKFLRREQLELLDVPGRDAAVPGRHAAARQRDHAIRIDVVLAGEPPDKRHPVERLVADLGQPGP